MTKRIWLTIVAVLSLLDQVSKWLFVTYWPDIVQHNTGVAFSAPVPKWLVIVISFLVIGAILYYFLMRKGDYKRSEGWIWAMVCAGAIGNLIDRVRLGYVIDFIDVGFWPVFNLADVYLSAAALMIFWIYVIVEKKNKL